MAQRLGATPESCAGLECFACVHGASAPLGMCPHTLTLKDHREHAAELHEDRLGGDFLVTTTPLLDERGEMDGAVHVARDITEHKRAEDALKESEKRFLHHRGALWRRWKARGLSLPRGERRI
jgi:PAS domain-containing protein